MQFVARIREVARAMAFVVGLNWKTAWSAVFAFPLGMHFVSEIVDRVHLSDALVLAVEKWRSLTQGIWAALLNAVPFDIAVPYGPAQMDALTLVACSGGVIVAGLVLDRAEGLGGPQMRTEALPEDLRDWAAQPVLAISLGTYLLALMVFGRVGQVQAPEWLSALSLGLSMSLPLVVLLGAKARRMPDPEWQEAFALANKFLAVGISAFLLINISLAFGLPEDWYEFVWFAPLYGAVLFALTLCLKVNWLGIPLAIVNAAMIVGLDWLVRVLAPMLIEFEQYARGLASN